MAALRLQSVLIRKTGNRWEVTGLGPQGAVVPRHLELVAALRALFEKRRFPGDAHAFAIYQLATFTMLGMELRESELTLLRRLLPASAAERSGARKVA